MLSPNFSCIFLFYGYHRTKSYHGYILSNSNNHIDQVTLSLLNRRNILTVFGGFFKVFMSFECYNPNNIRCAINSIGWEKNVPFRILVFRHFGRSALCIVCLMVVIVLLVLYLSHAYLSHARLVEKDYGSILVKHTLWHYNEEKNHENAKTLGVWYYLFGFISTQTLCN